MSDTPNPKMPPSPEIRDKYGAALAQLISQMSDDLQMEITFGAQCRAGVAGWLSPYIVFEDVRILGDEHSRRIQVHEGWEEEDDVSLSNMIAKRYQPREAPKLIEFPKRKVSGDETPTDIS